MKISIEWLKDYVDLPESPGELRQALTMGSLVVESATDFQGSPVLEVEVTSNRPDCLSYLGIAREVAAICGKKVREAPQARTLRAPAERIPYSIEILDPDLCPRYVGVVLDHVRVAPSPAWMQLRLEASGMRPVNNVVDITNYVLLERGHPLHAFDFDRLRDGKIVVSRARQGQKIVTLDGVERSLDDQVLLINDGGGPVAVGGVMGGQDSEISESTTRVLLECAYFLPVSIRRTGRKLGLSTEASYRFERGADWNGPPAAVARTCYLMRRLAGARIGGSVRDVYPRPVEPARIELRLARAESLLGVKLTAEFVESTLKRLEFKPARKGKGSWLVQCPSYRADMELEADLIEEIARFYGYQNLPTTVPPSRTAGKVSAVYPFQSAARRILLGMGCSETISLTFAAATELARFRAGPGRPVEIRNPLTDETQFLRSSLVPGLMRTARHNLNHGRSNLHVFEIGKVFSREPGGQVLERNRLGILGTGDTAEKNWHNSPAEYDFFHLKGVVSTLLSRMRGPEPEFVPASGIPWLNPGCAAFLELGGARRGVLGELQADVREELRLKQPVFVAEIDFEELYPLLFRPVGFEPLPRFPAAERDVSIVVSRDLEYRDLRQGLLNLGIAELAGLELVDVYEGNQIPAGKVGMTLRFSFQDRQGTLTVDRVQGFSDNIRTFLRDRYGAENR